MVKEAVKLFFESRQRWRLAQQITLDAGWIIAAWEFGSDGDPEHGYWIEFHGCQASVADIVQPQPDQPLLIQIYAEVDRAFREVLQNG